MGCMYAHCAMAGYIPILLFFIMLFSSISLGIVPFPCGGAIRLSWRWSCGRQPILLSTAITGKYFIETIISRLHMLSTTYFPLFSEISTPLSVPRFAP